MQTAFNQVFGLKTAAPGVKTAHDAIRPPNRGCCEDPMGHFTFIVYALIVARLAVFVLVAKFAVENKRDPSLQIAEAIGFGKNSATPRQINTNYITVPYLQPFAYLLCQFKRKRRRKLVHNLTGPLGVDCVEAVHFEHKFRFVCPAVSDSCVRDQRGIQLVWGNSNTIWVARDSFLQICYDGEILPFQSRLIFDA